MGKRGRGKEGLVTCEKCGRQTRRDKAVYIDKIMLANPLDRNQVADDAGYRKFFSREVCYCISCGKHGRIFEKKKRLNEMRRERANDRRAGSGPRPHHPYGVQRPAATTPQAQAPAAPAQQPAAKEPEKAA